MKVNNSLSNVTWRCCPVYRALLTINEILMITKPQCILQNVVEVVSCQLIYISME